MDPADTGDRRWSRGYLPHLDPENRSQHVTFHLADSLPSAALYELEEALSALPPVQRATERHHRLQRWLDAGHGCCALGDARAASLVQNALLHFDGQRYQVLGWVVMPNHVHAVVLMLPGHELRQTVASWKAFTARRMGPLLPAGHGAWHREYWDRYVRDQTHLETVLSYVHRNPVKAGLVQRAEDWPWSSAHQPPDAD